MHRKNKLCGRPQNYPPLQVDLWPFDLESGVRITCDAGYLCANFTLPRPHCSRLRPDVRDRQTDIRRASSLNAPTLGREHKKIRNMGVWGWSSFMGLSAKPDREYGSKLYPQRLKAFYPGDAMRKRGLYCRPVSVRLSVCHFGGLYIHGWRYRQTSCSAR